MDSHELVELSALVATHGHALILDERKLSESGIQHYWSASKCRLDRWRRTLRTFQQAASDAKTPWSDRHWQAVQPTLEEVLVSEVLTRLWTAVVIAHDQMHNHKVAESIVRNVMEDQMEVRHRVLSLLYDAPDSQIAEANAINQLRQRCERWSDLLVSRIFELWEVRDIAFDTARAAQFAETFQEKSRTGDQQQTWQMLLGSLRTSFQNARLQETGNGDLNSRLACGILSCFSPELVDSTSISRSLWLQRLSSMTEETVEMLEQMLASELEPVAAEPRNISW